MEKQSIKEIITSLFYNYEEHVVVSSDNYVLSLIHINGPKNSKSNETVINRKEPVLFQHGLLDSSDGWLCNEENQCLPLILANLGYDVWLGNSRGNKYSRKHLTFNPDKDYEFWQFSFEDLGKKDVPAFIEYIMKLNVFHDKLHYIGHSQGTCMMFAALTDDYYLEFYKNVLITFIALAPVARVGNLKSNLISIANYLTPDKFLPEEFMPAVKEGFQKSIGDWINKTFPQLSNFFIDLISDKDSFKVNNQNRMSLYLSKYPSGTSIKAIKHFSQNVASKSFSKFDYGKEANYYIYGNVQPSDYDLSKINGMKIALIAGVTDKLSNPKDVLWLKEQLGKNVVYFNEFDKMGHLTFLIGNNSDWFLDVVEIFCEHKSENERKKEEMFFSPQD